MDKRNNMQVNTPSIEYILRRITYTSWLMGVGVARPRNFSKTVTIIKCIVYLTVYTVNLVYSVIKYFKYSDFFALRSDIYEFGYFMNMVTLQVSTCYSIYHGLRHFEKWPELMDKIKKLDQKIRKQTIINDHPVKIMEALALLTTFAWCPLCLTLHVLYYYFTNPKTINEETFLAYYMHAQSIINSFVFDIIVYVIYYRFKMINKLIGQLNKSLSDPSWIALKIRRIRELYTGTCHLVSMVNDIYGLHLLLCSVNSFVTTMIMLHVIYMSVVEKTYLYILIDNIICILYVMQFGLMCWVCTLARQESDKIGRSVHEILFNCKAVNLGKINGARNQSNFEMRLPFEDSDSEQNSSSGYNMNYIVLENLLRSNLDREYVRKEINDFSIQLQLYRVAFTACDFFEINNALFSGFVGMIITYLIIFIQFYQRPEYLDEKVVERLSKIF